VKELSGFCDARKRGNREQLIAMRKGERKKEIGRERTPRVLPIVLLPPKGERKREPQTRKKNTGGRGGESNQAASSCGKLKKTGVRSSNHVRERGNSSTSPFLSHTHQKNGSGYRPLGGKKRGRKLHRKPEKLLCGGGPTAPLTGKKREMGR